jgi:hypothetical protein
LDLRILGREAGKEAEKKESKKRKLEIAQTIMDSNVINIAWIKEWIQFPWNAKRGTPEYDIYDEYRKKYQIDSSNSHTIRQVTDDFIENLAEEVPGLAEKWATAKQAGTDQTDIVNLMLQERRAEIARRAQEYEERRIENEERRAREQAERDEIEAIRMAEQLAWIAEFGSKRLKLMVEGGYNLQKTYENERLASELPGYEFMPKNYDTVKRNNPSLDALQEELRLKATGKYTEIGIVWMTENIDDDADDDADDEDGRENEGMQFEAVKVKATWCKKPIIRRITE